MSALAPIPRTLATPALVIDRARLEANVKRMAVAMAAAGVALRPHFKTSKMIAVARLQLSAGAVGLTCATAAEVEALLDAGIEDIFWANSPVGPVKARQAALFNQRGRVAVGLDSVALAEPLAAAADELGVTIPVLIEVDTGLGRTGVRAERAASLASALGAYGSLELTGVYTHEGQLAGLGGTRDELRAAGISAGEQLASVALELRAAGFAVPVVSVGSTPGWDSAPLAEGVTEARPGTYVFFDANQLRLESTTIECCALRVLTSVVSTQRDGAIVIDAGLKAMSSDPSNRGPSYGLALTSEGLVDPSLTFSTAYEEHGLLVGDGAQRYKVGDVLSVLPNHACGTVNMWSRIYVISGDGAVDIWTPIARH